MHFHQFLVSTINIKMQTKHKHQKTYTVVAVVDLTYEISLKD
jgi:hypothetical protein